MLSRLRSGPVEARTRQSYIVPSPPNEPAPSIAWPAYFRGPGRLKDGAKRRRPAAGEAGP